MTNIVKSKFAGLLRGLLRRFDDTGATNGTTVVAPPRLMAGTTFPRGSSPVATRPPRPQPDAAAPPAAPANGSSGLQLPLPSIIAGLPMDLRAKLAQTPRADACISIPVEKVLSQLARGSVKISFGELRGALPGLFVNSGTENDARQIALPLNEIISRINPALLSRRAVKKVELADDVAGPFGPRVQGVDFTPAQAPTRAGPMPPPKAPEPVSLPAAQKSVTPPTAFVPKTMATAPRPPRVAPAPIAPAAAVPPAPLKPVSWAPPRAPAAPVPFSPAPAAPAAGSFNSAPQIPVEKPILAPLSALAEKWPDSIKMELVQADLMSAQAALPPSLIEPGLKRGRVTILWKHLRMMVRPKPAPVSVHDGVEVELPLKVLAPLFFSSQKAAGLAKQKVTVSAEIPDLFQDSKQAEVAITPVPAPAFAPAPGPAPAPPALAKPADTNYFSKLATASDTELMRQASPGTDFMSRGATPKEVVARAMMLPGVVGAVVALYDGLKVASQLPPELNADTVAAFLPQIFSRTGQSTKELRMGELNNLNFTVGNVPWKIFRVNAIYFAAFGRAGEALPTAPLTALAALLDRKNI
jgi:predicted regulator of Ras-like GTPase activity (Roadblock/LC7/MglB family)